MSRALMLASLCCALHAGDLKIERVAYRALHFPPTELGGVVTYGADGATYFLRQGRGIVHRLADGESSLTKFALETPPEAAGGDLYFADIAINSQGEMYLAATWTFKPKGGGSAVFVYNASGRCETSCARCDRGIPWSSECPSTQPREAMF